MNICVDSCSRVAYLIFGSVIMAEEIEAVRIIVSGKVQGVFFRSSMKKFADENQVVGWVRNMEDGRVDSFVQGSKSGVQRVVDWCRVGPMNANVETLYLTRVRTIIEMRNFSILG